MAGRSNQELECLKILHPGTYEEQCICLDEDHGQVQENVVVFRDLNDGGKYYIHRGWSHFARALGLQDGYTLLLRYDGRAQINFKFFDLTSCRMQNPHNPEHSMSSLALSLPIKQPRSFTVILRKYHIKAKYLARNVPIDFVQAHGYNQHNIVELQMAGQSWSMGLGTSWANNVWRTSFKYGWPSFCADNDLNVGDTCFFSVIHDANFTIDDEWEEHEEDKVPKLRVELHTMKGVWRRRAQRKR